MDKKKFDADYFIQKFSEIPEDKWATYSFDRGDAHCALGHCLGDKSKQKLLDAGSDNTGKSLLKISEQERDTEFFEAYCLSLLFHKTGRIGSGIVIDINNGDHMEYQQPTPKQRILAALLDIKSAKQPEKKLRVNLQIEIPIELLSIAPTDTIDTAQNEIHN